ncbi:MAG: hypothetical protein IPL49_14225 [Saprospirales bacterium]|nr:hypothetical protein [Saprospirales bacterium]MBK8492002.1 hypothetical protein [Saprospirales bacterium]
MRIAIIVVLLIMSMGLGLQAQPGLYVSYQNLEAPYWNLLNPKGPSFFQHGFGAGVQYRIPLSKGSFGFIPGLNYAFFQQKPTGSSLNEAHLFQLRAGLRVFPMEFLLSCDCPAYRRGLFAEGFVGWSRWNFRHQEVDVQLEDATNAPLVGLGAGFFLPYGKHITLAPVFRYSFYPSVKWEGLNALRNPDTDPYFREETFLRQMSFEIHILFDH